MKSTIDYIKPIRLNTDQRARFVDAQNKRFVPILQVTLIFAIIVYPLWMFWDHVMAPEKTYELFMLRFSAIGFFFAALAFTFIPKAEEYVGLIGVMVVSGAVLNATLVLYLHENGFGYGISVVFIPMLIIAIMPTMLNAFASSVLSLIVVNGFMMLEHSEVIDFFSINYFLFIYAAMALGLAYLVIQDRARTVLTEIEMEEMAETDELTGLNNRRYFMSQAMEVQRALRYKRPLSLLLIDIDHFKKINDNYGHHNGDIALKSLAAQCQNILRSSDQLARMNEDDQDNSAVFSRLGGEEFSILLPETDVEGAHILAERLRKLISETPIVSDEGKIIKMTPKLLKN